MFLNTMQNSIKLLLLLILLTISFCKQKQTIEGHIKGLGNDTLIVEYMTIPKHYKSGEKYRFTRDTIVAKNDKFNYDNISNETKTVKIYSINRHKKLSGTIFIPESMEIFMQVLPDDKIKIDGTIHKYHIDYTVKGSTISNEDLLVRKKKLKTMVEQAKNYLRRDTLRFNNGDAQKIEKISLKIKENRKLYKKIDFEYINNNWDKHYTAYLLWTRSKIYDNYKKISNEVRNGVYKPIIDYEIARKKRITDRKKKVLLNLITEGKKAPDFTLQNINNTSLTLSSAIQAKEYTVLDFWGSWCLPCIKGFPDMKKYYNKYSTRIAFISIACSDTDKKWRQAVKEHKLIWPQLINNSNEGFDVSEKYVVTTYPTKIIINKQQEIVAVFKGESEYFYKKLDELMQ